MLFSHSGDCNGFVSRTRKGITGSSPVGSTKSSPGDVIGSRARLRSEILGVQVSPGAPSRRREMRNCLACDATIFQRKNVYCGNACQKDHAYFQYIERWQEGLESGVIGKIKALSKHVRRFLRESKGAACAGGMISTQMTEQRLPK